MNNMRLVTYSQQADSDVTEPICSAKYVTQYSPLLGGASGPGGIDATAGAQDQSARMACLPDTEFKRKRC
jgi:hypothetical protein